MTDQNDKYSERRELITAGWDPRDVEGRVVWQNPANGYWYPQDLALQLVRPAMRPPPHYRGEGKR